MKLKELLLDDNDHKFDLDQEVRIFSSATEEWIVLSVYYSDDGAEIMIDIEELTAQVRADIKEWEKK